MNQSKINAGSINQKSVQAVSTAISNSININAQSINSQCTEHQHAKHSVFISKAPSVSVQCTLRQQPLNATLTSMRSSSTSMLRVSTASVKNINNQCTLRQNQCALHQHPMRIAPDSLMFGFSSTKTFTLCSMPLTPVILRGAEGEVAETILTESTLALGVWDDRLQRPFSLRGKVLLRFLKQWILQLRVNPACRMT